MDLDIEWLFEEVYEQRRAVNKLYFLSDWDSEAQEIEQIKGLIKNVHTTAASSSKQYKFSYEQFDIRESITNVIKETARLTISPDELSVTPNSTLSIFLVLNSLKKLGVKRVLLFTPAYFSLINSLKEIGLEVIYYHLKDDDNFSIDPDHIRDIIREQFIECMILTDPIYCAGVSITDATYTFLSAVCNENGIYLVIDYSLGGLNWIGSPESLLPSKKMEILLGTGKYCLIDSMPKKMLLNGLKFSVVFASYPIIDQIDKLSESLYGAMNSIQLELLKQVYNPTNQSILNQQHTINVDTVRDNYNLIKSQIKETEFRLYPTNTGFFSVLFSKKYRLKDIDTKKYLLNILREKKILCISTDRFAYFKENRFGVRVNLTKDPLELASSIDNLIRFHRDIL
jgi:aspartate/methionine/tyrosine aminotransferase